MASWCVIPCSRKELSLGVTLSCGQSFRWKEIQPGVWRSVLAGRIWTLKQTDHQLLYQVHDESLIEGTCKDYMQMEKKSKKRRKKESSPPKMTLTCSEDVADPERVLRDYFQLDTELVPLYEKWKSVDKNFADRGSLFPGVRILRQDPVENLFSFICSSNNNISRISGMVDKLCSKYGTLAGILDGDKWYNFPSVSSLAGRDTESELRKLGFGYRAKFIHQTAKILSEERSTDWLQMLRKLSYEEAHAELQKLPGVGAKATGINAMVMSCVYVFARKHGISRRITPRDLTLKVSDCVCLFSLDKPGAIPVDTHVWQIASRDYMPELKSKKSLTDKTYREIGEFFRELFGEYAGWAHSVLFSADLKKFQEIAEGRKSQHSGDEEVVHPNKKQRKSSKKPRKKET